MTSAWWIVPALPVGWVLGLLLWVLTERRRDRVRRVALPRPVVHTQSMRVELHRSVTADELAGWIAARGGLPAGPARLLPAPDSDRPGYRHRSGP